jgi:hypothetical protein
MAARINWAKLGQFVNIDIKNKNNIYK